MTNHNEINWDACYVMVDGKLCLSASKFQAEYEAAQRRELAGNVPLNAPAGDEDPWEVFQKVQRGEREE